MYLTYLGPVSCFVSRPEFLSAHHRHWQSPYSCQMAHIVSFLVLCPPDSEISFGGLESLMSVTSILLIRQEIFHFSAIILIRMWAFIKSLNNLCGSLGAEDGHWTIHSIGVVHLLSCVRLFATPWKVAHQASLSITNSQSLLKLTSHESVMISNHLILCHPLLLLPSIFPSIRIFSNESVLSIR